MFSLGTNFVKGRQPAQVSLSIFLSLSLVPSLLRASEPTKRRQFILSAAGKYAYPIYMACICRMRLLLLLQHLNWWQRQQKPLWKLLHLLNVSLYSKRELEIRTSSIRARARARCRGWGRGGGCAAASGRHLCVDTSKMKVQCTLSVSLRCATSAFHQPEPHLHGWLSQLSATVAVSVSVAVAVVVAMTMTVTVTVL